jgi:hypothetical protein
MLIIGCDFHTRYQQIAMVDEATGELVERRLDSEWLHTHADLLQSNLSPHSNVRWTRLGGLEL